MLSHGCKCPDSLEPGPIVRIIDKYRDHLSIKLIKAKNNSRVLNFIQINIEEVKISFQDLDPNKASQKGDIKTNLRRKNASFFAKYTRDDINASIRLSKFSNELKRAGIMPANKKKSKLSKESSRHISILPNISLRFMKDVYSIK